MSNVEKFPFEYIVEATDKNPNHNMKIETPWLDEDKDLMDQVEFDLIYRDNSLTVSEYKYENGFNFISIVKAEKSIIKSNWELDYIPSTGEYLPKIQ